MTNENNFQKPLNDKIVKEEVSRHDARKDPAIQISSDKQRIGRSIRAITWVCVALILAIALIVWVIFQ